MVRIKGYRSRIQQKFLKLSLHEGCQLNAIWKCLVVLYHIMFKIKGVSLHFREELAPWRRAHNVAESGIKLSVQGTQTMEKFDKETRHVMPIGNTSVFIQIQSGKIFWGCIKSCGLSKAPCRKHWIGGVYPPKNSYKQCLGLIFF